MKHVLCLSLLFALPAYATISQRQSPVSQFNASDSYLPRLGSMTEGSRLSRFEGRWPELPSASRRPLICRHCCPVRNKCQLAK